MSTRIEKVVPLHRCGSCGGQGQPVDLKDVDDGSVTTILVCVPCHKRHQKSLDRVRPVFNTMRKIGVPKAVILEVMGCLLDQWPDPEATR